MHKDRFYTLTVSCPDRVGIAARVAGFIAGHGGWMLESSYHADDMAGRYFMRIEVGADSLPFDLAGFKSLASHLIRQAKLTRATAQTGAVTLIH